MKQKIETQLEQIYLSVFQEPPKYSVSKANIPKWTSLKEAEFIIRVQEDFGVSFSFSDLESFDCYQNILDRVKEIKGA